MSPTGGKLAGVRPDDLAAIAGVRSEMISIGPESASRKAVKRAGLAMRDIDVVEINEAFGSHAVASICQLEMRMVKVNIGGGISIGHPLSATGVRNTARAAQIMKREGKLFALATQYFGGGQGIATVIEAVRLPGKMT